MHVGSRGTLPVGRSTPSHSSLLQETYLMTSSVCSVCSVCYVQTQKVARHHAAPSDIDGVGSFGAAARLTLERWVVMGESTLVRTAHIHHRLGLDRSEAPLHARRSTRSLAIAGRRTPAFAPTPTHHHFHARQHTLAYTDMSEAAVSRWNRHAVKVLTLRCKREYKVCSRTTQFHSRSGRPTLAYCRQRKSCRTPFRAPAVQRRHSPDTQTRFRVGRGTLPPKQQGKHPSTYCTGG